MRIESSFIQIPGIGEKSEQALWEAGITDWRDGVDDSVISHSRRRRIDAFRTEAEAHLEATNVQYFSHRLPSAERWRLAESFRDNITALDIETTGLDQSRDYVTTVSLFDSKGAKTFIRGQDLTAQRLTSALEETDLLVTYNGARFDIPFLEAEFNLTVDRPHLDIMYPCQSLGWRGGLKAVERRLGIERSLPDIDGLEAVRLWRQYQRGSERALDRLVRYNQEDVRTLLPIVDEIVQALDTRLFYPHVPETYRN